MWATVDIVEIKKALQVVNSIIVDDPEGPFRDRQLYPSRDDNVPFFFKRLPRTSFSCNSLFHIIPIIHTVPLARARALIRGRLPDSAARIN